MRAIAALAAVFPVVAAAQALLASGACRDGIPNGMYELRTPAGALRVAGAFAMERPHRDVPLLDRCRRAHRGDTL